MDYNSGTVLVLFAQSIFLKKHIMFNFLIIWNRIYCDIFINKSANMFFNLLIFYYPWDLFNYFNIMNCKAFWSISGVSAI